MKSSMYKLVCATLLAFSTQLVHADTLKIYVSEQGEQASAKTPVRGLSMDNVRKSYGEPAQAKGPVGEPPITVWSYDQFTVYFERDKVIRTVLNHKPAY